jgi:hypothetical protein
VAEALGQNADGLRLGMLEDIDVAEEAFDLEIARIEYVAMDVDGERRLGIDKRRIGRIEWSVRVERPAGRWGLKRPRGDVLSGARRQEDSLERSFLP